MVIEILLLVLGFVLLIFGAEWLVNGASSLARRYKVSDLAIGLTIVAFGTSAPELVVNTIAAYQGEHALVFGNVIGSNNFNLFMILGIAGLISPLVVQSSTVYKEVPFSLLAAIVLFILVNGYFGSGPLSLNSAEGFVLLLFFAGFLFYVYRQLKSDPSPSSVAAKDYSTSRIFILIIIGLVGLIAGGRLVVDNAIVIATSLGMSEKIIGLTIVAAGTSLPELATSVVAAIKKNNDIAVGNIVGSNIFNIFFILGVSAFFGPIEFDPAFNTDLYILGAGTVFLFLAMFTGKKKRLDRWEAALLLLAYLVYVTYMIYK